MIKRPAVPITIAFTVGILLAGLGVSPSAGLYLLFGVLVGTGVTFRKRIPVILVLIAVVSVGWLRYSAYTQVAPDDISHYAWQKITGFQGMIISDPDVRENRTYAVVRAVSILHFSEIRPTSGNVMLTVYSPMRSDLEYGQRVFVRSNVHPPMSAKNPGDFSWMEYLAKQRIYTAASVRSDDNIVIMPGGGGNPVIYGSLGIKRWLESGITTMFPSMEGQLIKGILLGNYALLPDDLIVAFSRSGTLHLLAASGFNCMVLITVFGLPLTYGLKVSKSQRSAILIALLILYLLIIGAKPSILRATIMASLVLLAYPLKRSADGTNLLFAAALLILAIRPTDIFDVGFQLSFAAVAAIIAILPLLQTLIHTAGWVPEINKRSRGWSIKACRWICRNTTSALAMTTAVMLGTAPLVAHYFNYFSIISPIANTAVAITIEPLFSLGLSAPFVREWPIFSEMIRFFGGLLAHSTLEIINHLGNLPYASLSVASPGFLPICGYYVLLGGFVSYVSSKLVRK